MSPKFHLERPAGIRKIGKFRSRVTDSLLCFRVALRKEDLSTYYVDVPDVVQPYGDEDYRWSLIGGDTVGIIPFTKVPGGGSSMLTTFDGQSDIYNVICEIEDPSILSVTKGPMEKNNGNLSQIALFKCLQNGRTRVKLQIMNLREGGKIVYSRMVEFYILNPEWPSFLNDVKGVNVIL